MLPPWGKEVGIARPQIRCLWTRKIHMCRKKDSQREPSGHGWINGATEDASVVGTVLGETSRGTVSFVCVNINIKF